VLLAGLISENTSGNRSNIPLVDQLGDLGKLIAATPRRPSAPSHHLHPAAGSSADGVDAMRVAEELPHQAARKLGTTQPIYRQQ